MLISWFKWLKSKLHKKWLSKLTLYYIVKLDKELFPSEPAKYSILDSEEYFDELAHAGYSTLGGVESFYVNAAYLKDLNIRATTELASFLKESGLDVDMISAIMTAAHEVRHRVQRKKKVALLSPQTKGVKEKELKDSILQLTKTLQEEGAASHFNNPREFDAEAIAVAVMLKCLQTRKIDIKEVAKLTEFSQTRGD